MSDPSDLSLRTAFPRTPDEAVSRREAPRRVRLLRAGRNVLLIGLAGLFLAGCGKSAQNAANAPAGQVVAHVGKQDVTINELDNEFRLAQIPADKRNDAVTKAILGELVKRKYLAQKAVTAGMDREPGVLLEMLRSREQILASAFVYRDVSTKAAAIGKTEVDNYIATHPLKFEKRQLMTVEQITIPITANTQAAVEATKDAKTLDEVDTELTGVGALHNRTMGVMNTGNMSADFYNTLQTKTNDVFFVRTGNTGVFFKVKAQEPQPLTGDDAAKLARQLIVQELLQAETSNKAPAADIEIKYEGNYAKIMSAEAPPANQKPEAEK